ncbi:hypothetical protein JOF35_004509 [Streptomyces demainii]|uniref:Uncharacterized protein n=1 Tax=Streptomyces demainii TaxID=588122 RepID=A0ABT9KXJ8_9ACTN|nr:hypothetical protein [Streptomyces demainii]
MSGPPHHEVSGPPDAPLLVLAVRRRYVRGVVAARPWRVRRGVAALVDDRDRDLRRGVAAASGRTRQLAAPRLAARGTAPGPGAHAVMAAGRRFTRCAGP